jgi:hypothetical protein
MLMENTIELLSIFRAPCVIRFGFFLRKSLGHYNLGTSWFGLS